jgi:NAD(P)-dependent dehydrogenase (short-subunit alcohol dehydrogenase family)
MMNETPVAIITGAASGIGQSTAQLLASRGYRVAIADLRGPAALDTAEAIRASGFEAMPVTVDVADETSGKAMVEAVDGWTCWSTARESKARSPFPPRMQIAAEVSMANELAQQGYQ